MSRTSRPISHLVDGPEQALDVANAIAPEHLELMTADPEALVPLVRHAGAVFTAVLPKCVGVDPATPTGPLPSRESGSRLNRDQHA